MAGYLATKIMNGTASYTQVFSVSIYKVYKEAVDAILIDEGRQDLIV